MNVLLRGATGCAVVASVAALLLGLGCGKTQGMKADPEPFKKAIAEYLESHNMAMAFKEIKDGPTVEGTAATLTASLTHATLGGPAVTWQFRFEKSADGTWKAVSHK
jgi:hypothetical protein